MYRSSGPVFRSRPQSAPHRRYFKAQSPKSPEPDEYRRIKTDHRVAFIRLPPDPASTRLSAAIRETVVPTSLIIRSKFHPVASRLQSFPNGRTARGPSLPATSSGAVPHTAIFRRREPSGPSCFLPRSSLRRASAPHTAKPRRHAQRISPRQSHIQRTAGKSGPPHPTIVARNSPTRHRRNASLRRKFGGPFACVRAAPHHPGRIELQHSAVRSRTTDRLTNRGQSIAVTGTGTFQKREDTLSNLFSAPVRILPPVPENNASTVPIRLLILHSARLPHHLHTTRGQKSVRVRFVFSPSPRRSPTSRLRHRNPAPVFPLSIVLPPPFDSPRLSTNSGPCPGNTFTTAAP